MKGKGRSRVTVLEDAMSVGLQNLKVHCRAHDENRSLITCWVI
jgi:hypothetical protein